MNFLFNQLKVILIIMIIIIHGFIYAAYFNTKT